MSQAVTPETIASTTSTQLDLDLRDLLMPPSRFSTQELVESSGIARIHEWMALARCGAILLESEFEQRSRETFAGLQEEPEDVTYRRLASPIFRGWIKWTGIGLQNLEQHHRMIGSHLALWNNMRYSLAEPGQYEATLGVVDGICYTWDPRVICETGPLHQIHVVRDGSSLTIMGPDGEMLWDGHVTATGSQALFSRPGVRIVHAPCLPDTEVAVRADIPALRLKLSGTNERDTGIVLGELDNQSVYDGSGTSLCLEAADILRQCWSDEYDDFRKTLQVVVPRRSSSDNRAKGMTVASHQGAIWVMADDLLAMYESMVHEQSHVKLRYIEEACPILEQNQTEERFQVAWRLDPRPIIGIHEGIYVSIHSVHAIDCALDAGLVKTVSRDGWAARSAQLKVNVLEAVPIMREHARFTESGKVFLDWATDAVS